MKTLSILIITLLSFSCANKCPSVYDEITGKEVFTVVDEMPKFSDNHFDLMQYVISHFKHQHPSDGSMPEYSFNIEFVIDIDGSVIGARIPQKDPSHWTPNEKQLIAILENMPKWKEGKCDGKKVPVFSYLPLKINPRGRE